MLMKMNKKIYFIVTTRIYICTHVKFLDRFLPGSCRKFFFEFLRILFISGPGIWWFLAYYLFTIILIFIFKMCKRLFSQVVKVEKHDPGQCLIEISMRHPKRLSRESQENLLVKIMVLVKNMVLVIIMVLIKMIVLVKIMVLVKMRYW
jgi:hypothetical protein